MKVTYTAGDKYFFLWNFSMCVENENAGKHVHLFNNDEQSWHLNSLFGALESSRRIFNYFAKVDFNLICING